VSNRFSDALSTQADKLKPTKNSASDVEKSGGVSRLTRSFTPSKWGKNSGGRIALMRMKGGSDTLIQNP
jgi:hypothetical protein